MRVHASRGVSVEDADGLQAEGRLSAGGISGHESHYPRGVGRAYDCAKRLVDTPLCERDERVAHERDALPQWEERDDFVVTEEQDVHLCCDATEADTNGLNVQAATYTVCA